MTVNISSLITYLGASYKDIRDAGLIPYSTEPKGHSGSPTLSLEMAREGIFLSFKREGKILKEITLYIQKSNVVNWVFPNKLPAPLQCSMSREWILKTLGSPDGSVQPRKVLKHFLGWADKYHILNTNIPITMQIDYDLTDMVMEISYILTTELRW